MKEIKKAKQSKKNIEVGSIVVEKVGEAEEKTREGRSRNMREEVVGCVHSIVGKKQFLVQFEDGQKRDMGSCLLTSVCSKEEFGHEVNEPISNLHKKEGDLLTIDGNPVGEGGCMFGEDTICLFLLFMFC